MDTIEKRSFLKYILLSILTLGIYSIISFYRVGKDVNKICKGDNKEQCSFIVAMLLGLITFGIYTIYWEYKAMERLKDNAYRYGVMIQYGGSDFLLWSLLGSIIYIGPFIAIMHMFENLNRYANVYGQVEPSVYTENFGERLELKPKAIESGASKHSDGQSFENINIDPSGSTEGYGNSKYKKGKITGLSGMYSGADIPIVNNEIIKIGKDPSRVNIIVDDNFVSSLHCEIQYDAINNSYIVTDNSTNGTYFSDGRRLHKGTPTRVSFGTIICIANAQNSFKLN